VERGGGERGEGEDGDARVLQHVVAVGAGGVEAGAAIELREGAGACVEAVFRGGGIGGGVAGAGAEPGDEALGAFRVREGVEPAPDEDVVVLGAQEVGGPGVVAGDAGVGEGLEGGVEVVGGDRANAEGRGGRVRVEPRGAGGGAHEAAAELREEGRRAIEAADQGLHVEVARDGGDEDAVIAREAAGAHHAIVDEVEGVDAAEWRSHRRR
jgi:hypothetical protein